MGSQALLVTQFTLHAMLCRLIQCLHQVAPQQVKHLSTHRQLEVVVFPKQPKVHMKVMNVPIVVHVMEKVVYVHVTKVTPAKHAKHKQFWFKFEKKTSLNSKQKRDGNFTVDFKM